MIFAILHEDVALRAEREERGKHRDANRRTARNDADASDRKRSTLRTSFTRGEAVEHVESAELVADDRFDRVTPELAEEPVESAIDAAERVAGSRGDGVARAEPRFEAAILPASGSGVDRLDDVAHGHLNHHFISS